MQWKDFFEEDNEYANLPFLDFEIESYTLMQHFARELHRVYLFNALKCDFDRFSNRFRIYKLREQKPLLID